MKEFLQLLFEKVTLGQIICVYSDLSETELENAPQQVKIFFAALPKKYTQKVEVKKDAFKIAQKYIDEKVVGQTSVDDCRHIATATIHKVDYLVSWNFKYIVNVFRIRGYNSVNLRNGFSQIDVRSPKDIVNNQDEN